MRESDLRAGPGSPVGAEGRVRRQKPPRRGQARLGHRPAVGRQPSLPGESLRSFDCVRNALGHCATRIATHL